MDKKLHNKVNAIYRCEKCKGDMYLEDTKVTNRHVTHFCKCYACENKMAFGTIIYSSDETKEIVALVDRLNNADTSSLSNQALLDIDSAINLLLRDILS